MMWLLVTISLVFTADEGPKVSLLLASSYEECTAFANAGNAGAFDRPDRARKGFFCYRLTQ